MSVFRVSHLHIICQDLDSMSRFFTSGLGASFKEYRSFGGADGAVLTLDTLPIYLRVPTEKEHIGRRDVYSGGYDHLGLEVDDLDAACDRLAGFGCLLISEPVERGNKKIAFLHGPEELTLELIQLI